MVITPQLSLPLVHACYATLIEEGNSHSVCNAHFHAHSAILIANLHRLYNIDVLIYNLLYMLILCGHVLAYGVVESCDMNSVLLLL